MPCTHRPYWLRGADAGHEPMRRLRRAYQAALGVRMTVKPPCGVEPLEVILGLGHRIVCGSATSS